MSTSRGEQATPDSRRSEYPTSTRSSLPPLGDRGAALALLWQETGDPDELDRAAAAWPERPVQARAGWGCLGPRWGRRRRLGETVRSGAASSCE